MKLLPVLLLALASCVSIGNDFDPAKTAELRPGVTTLAGAARILGGAPTSEVLLEDGSRRAVWMHSTPLGDVRTFVATFGPDGVLLARKTSCGAQAPAAGGR